MIRGIQERRDACMQGSRERREGLRKRGMQGSRKGGRDAGKYVCI